MRLLRKSITTFILLGLILALTPSGVLAALTFTNKTTLDGLGNNSVYGVYVEGNTVYAATYGGGLAISTDGGASFTKRTTADGLGTNSAIGVFADGNNVYVATLSGLAISTDGGASFTNRTTANGLGNNYVDRVYADDNIIYAATLGGLSISTDGGTNFTNRTTANGLANNFVTDVFVVGNIVYAGTTNGLSISTDGGSSFTTRTTVHGLGSNYIYGLYVIGNTVYAATWGGYLAISTDGGNSFTVRNSTNGVTNNLVTDVFAVGSMVYASSWGGGLFVSSDSGISFTVYTIANGLGSNLIRDVYGGGGAIYAGTIGGVSFSFVDPTAPQVSSTNLAATYSPTGPSSFTVTYSENVSDAGGGAVTDDVTNPGNYLLVERNDTIFDTPSCASGLQVDDTQVTVDSVTYDSGTFTATVNINGGVGLPVGNYRLFVCGTTSIIDLTGNPLNGGEDYVFSFIVQAPAPAALPRTGFAPGRITHLPLQPADKAYTSNDLVLEIPDLGVSASIVGVPFVDGEWDVSWLGNSAGWLEGTSFPTYAGNTGITAHVWDANNNPGPFANLNKLKHGDVVKIHAWGYEYTYSVRYNYLTTPTNTTPLRHEEYDWITLLTCEYYSSTYDNYRFRRVVRAVLVDVDLE